MILPTNNDMEECPVLKCQAELIDGVRVPVMDSALRDRQFMH